MRKQLMTAFIFTIVTTLLLGIAYPLAITLAAHLMMPDKADGQLIHSEGVVVGSRLIGQSFTGSAWFNSRPSAAGTGYDASNSSGSNLGPTNAALVTRVQQSVQSLQPLHPGIAIPIDLVTASGSGLDPDITPAAAEYQVAGIARSRRLNQTQIENLVHAHIQPRQFGFLGEPRVNVLQLNLALQELTSATGKTAQQ